MPQSRYKGETYQRQYIGPEGELYPSYPEQMEAWATYGQEEYIDLLPVSKQKGMPQREEIYQLHIEQGTLTIKSASGLNIGKLVEEEGKIKLYTIGAISDKIGMKLDQLLPYVKATTPTIETKIIQTKEAALSAIYATRRTKDLLPNIKQVTQLLSEEYYASHAFNKFVQDTKA